VEFTGLKADFWETNFYENLERAHLYLHGPHEPVIILGSSLSARLLPQYFAESGCDVGNLGLDGCKGLTGLQLLLQRRDLPEIVLLEENTLFAKPDANDREVVEAINGFDFWLATKIPVLQPQTRPSSIFYSLIKEKRDQRIFIAGPQGTSPATPTPTAIATNAAASSQKVTDTEKQVEDLIAELQRRGVKIGLFQLPAGENIPRSNQASMIPARDLSQTLGLLPINLDAEMVRQNLPIIYTDGHHLATPSARGACTILAAWVRHRLQSQHE
jgi:hypothetical protein